MKPTGQTLSPWQLTMFRRSIKKRQKLKALLGLLGATRDSDCLLLSCGDNNGALNWYFREQGGCWMWADVSGEETDPISQLLNEPVHSWRSDTFPLPAETFDCVVAIDVLEHLPQDQPFLKEVRRVLKPTGRAVVTVPNGDPRLFANRIKWQVGMTPEVYGHTRAGYTVQELTEAVCLAGFQPQDSGGYSRFFTEMIELVINFGYVRVLSKKRGGPQPGHIAPVSSGELKTYGLAYKLYGIMFPVLRALSLLDGLLPASTNNAVIVTAVKQDNL